MGRVREDGQVVKKGASRNWFRSWKRWQKKPTREKTGYLLTRSLLIKKKRDPRRLGQP